MTVKMFSGDTRRLRITVTDENNNNQPLDLTNAFIEFAASRTVKTDKLMYKNTNPSPGGVEILSPPTAGVFVVFIDPPDTEGFNGKYYFECMVTEEGGDVSTVLTNYLVVTPTLITP